MFCSVCLSHPLSLNVLISFPKRKENLHWVTLYILIQGAVTGRVVKLHCLQLNICYDDVLVDYKLAREGRTYFIQMFSRKLTIFHLSCIHLLYFIQFMCCSFKLCVSLFGRLMFVLSDMLKIAFNKRFIEIHRYIQRQQIFLWKKISFTSVQDKNLVFVFSL